MAFYQDIEQNKNNNLEIILIKYPLISSEQITQIIFNWDLSFDSF